MAFTSINIYKAMANHPVKYNRDQPRAKYNNDQHRADTWKQNWAVMKPFVHFGFKAMVLLGGALVGIIKLLPTLLEHKEEQVGRP